MFKWFWTIFSLGAPEWRHWSSCIPALQEQTKMRVSLSLSEFKITATKQRTKAILIRSKAAKLLTNVYNIDILYKSCRPPHRYVIHNALISKQRNHVLNKPEFGSHKWSVRIRGCEDVTVHTALWQSSQQPYLKQCFSGMTSTSWNKGAAVIGCL